jgi:hypothetical protein
VGTDTAVLSHTRPPSITAPAITAAASAASDQYCGHANTSLVVS